MCAPLVDVWVGRFPSESSRQEVEPQIITYTEMIQVQGPLDFCNSTTKKYLNVLGLSIFVTFLHSYSLPSSLFIGKYCAVSLHYLSEHYT